MALSRSEIELIIKARNQAQGAFDQLNTQLKGITGESEKSTQGLGGVEKKTKDSGVAAGAAGVAFGLLAERVGRGLVSAFNDTIEAANRLDSGLIGLRSVATAFKQDAGQAEQAAKRLAQDGLLSVGDAATALKNLLAAGFGLPEAVTLVERFKDSAAFGRQAALGFGQAVTSATEGIKNGNSILVDNAGVTKNLSQILVEAGFSAQDLSKASSDVNIRMALFNGIVKETGPQLGDAARYLDTTAGKAATFSAQVTTAQEKLGKQLQPALAGVLSVLQPLVQAVGNNAAALVPLGIAAATVVTPLAAMQAAAALGLTNIGGLGAKALTAVGNLGAFGSAAAVAGAAFVGWQIGRAISEVLGLDEAIRKATVSLGLYADVAEQTALAKQDVINRAFQQGAPMVLSYAGAIDYNKTVLVAHQQVVQGNTAALRAKLEAQLKIGEITRAQFNDQIQAVVQEERHQAALRNAPALREAAAAAERKYKDEIANTGLTLGQLQAAIRTNEEAFDGWAASVGLSDTTVKRLKDSLKANNEEHKKATAEAKKAAEAQEKFQEQLEKATGILTQKGLNEQLQKFSQYLAVAAGQGTPALTTAVRTLWPELVQLEAKAKASGLAVDQVRATMQLAAQAAGLLTEGVRTFSTYVPLVQGVTEANRVNTAEVRLHYEAQDRVNRAYQAFGLQTPDQLRAVAEAARENYAALVGSGTASTQQLKDAYRQMIEAQREATGRLPGFWETDVFPRIKNTVEQLSTAINGTFAQMLLGAKGFGDGMKDIWESIKASAMKVFTEILSDFTNRFLKGLLGALSGQQGAFSQAFGGMMGGPGGGGGGAGFWASLFGGGGAPVGLTGAGSSPGIAAAGLGLPGAGGAGAGAGGAGSAAGLIGGGLAAGAAGYGLGQLGQRLFGGAGWGAGAFGAGSGAATGAAIGSILPGIGTAAGAIIGGLAGALSGALGRSAGEKANDIRDQFFANFGGGGTGEGSGFNTVAAMLARISPNEGGGEGGGSLFRNLIKADNVKELEAAIKAVIAALQRQEQQTQETGAATESAAGEGTAAYQDSIQAVESLRAREQALADQIQRTQDQGGDTAPLNEMMADLQTQIAAAEEESRRLASTVDRTREATDGVATLQRGFYDLWRDIERAGGAADSLFDTLRDMPGAPNAPGAGTGVEGGAAGGVYANRPGLVLFGEGGQPEVGGPRSFFKQVFDDLGVASGFGSTGGGTGGGVTMNVTINALDGASVRDVFYNQIVPMMKDALRGNVNGFRTDVQVALR